MLSAVLTLTLVLQAAAAAAVGDGQGFRKLVLANHYGLHWSPLSATPTGEVAFFLGSSLRPLRGLRGRVLKSALGYEVAVSAGGADRATSILSWGGDYGVVYHRHHISALGYGGPGDRLFYQFGGGLMLWRSTVVALEADARLGVVLGVARGTRVKGVVGGHARLVGILGGLPLPHFGVFAGLFLF